MDDLGDFRQDALHETFGPNLAAGADTLNELLTRLDIATWFAEYAASVGQRAVIIDEVFAAERGRSYAGTKYTIPAAKKAMHSSRPKVA